jgi:hypothetical protein
MKADREKFRNSILKQPNIEGRIWKYIKLKSTDPQKIPSQPWLTRRTRGHGNEIVIIELKGNQRKSQIPIEKPNLERWKWKLKLL